MTAVEDENILKSDQPGESVVQFQEPRGSVANTNIVSERIVSDSTVPQSEGSHMESGQGSSVNKAFELASQSSLLQTTEGSTMVHDFAFKLHNGTSLDDEKDPFPDIVDEDPDDFDFDFDSDSEEA